jgi:hypothetical protein
MGRPNATEREVNAIRDKLYEEIKDMSPAEMNAYISSKVAPIEKQFHMKVVDAPPPREYEYKVAL